MGSVASLGRRSRVASMSTPALCPRTSSAPSVGSPTTSPSTSLASLAIRKGKMASSMVSVEPAACSTLPFQAVARAGDGVAVGRTQ